MNQVKLDTREMDRIIKDSGKSGINILNRLAFEVEADAKQNAPVDTGALRNSGFTEPATPENKTAIVGFTVEYAIYQELGTHKMAAHPFLVPAVEKIARKFNSGETWQEMVR